MKCYPSGRILVVLAAFGLAACADSPVALEVDGDMANGRGGSASVEIWWPSNGANVSGVQPFKARVPSLSLSQYDMYWQVDGGQLTRMGDSQVDGPHKEIPVDVSAFTWRGAGPYRINFVARDRKNKVIAQKSVDITVGTNSPPPPPVESPSNIFAGARLWVDPNSRAKQQADAWRAARPADASQMDRIAAQPQSIWFNGWHSDIRAAVAAATNTIVQAGALPLYVAYNLPYRDCGSYSAGGTATADAYRNWIRAFATGLGATRAAIILEPDALAGLGCLSTVQRDERYALIADAVEVFRAQGSAVYLDAGHSSWIPAAEMANRLHLAGIARADGFALNVSNFQTTSANVAYGTTLSALVGGKHFVIDSSRNGLGPTSDNQWCNPADRALGNGPTAYTGSDLVDALVWIKKPGESDGTCNGGPGAGQWWADYALGLAQRTPVLVAYSG